MEFCRGENFKIKLKKKAPPEGSGAVNFNSLPKGIVAPHQSLGLNFNEGTSLFSFNDGKLFGFRYFQGIIYDLKFIIRFYGSFFSNFKV